MSLTDAPARAERPIIFTGESVKEILRGTKKQTRRILKPQPPTKEAVHKRTGTDFSIRSATWAGRPEQFRICGPVGVACELAGLPNDHHWICPYGRLGDRLWVREAWVKAGGHIRYPATDHIHELRKTRSPIHMPRSASRLSLEVLKVRIESLRDISDRDAEAEGYGQDSPILYGDDPISEQLAHLRFKTGWDRINARRGFGWDTNPWVWVIEFKVV